VDFLKHIFQTFARKWTYSSLILGLIPTSTHPLLSDSLSPPHSRGFLMAYTVLIASSLLPHDLYSLPPQASSWSILIASSSFLMTYSLSLLISSSWPMLFASSWLPHGLYSLPHHPSSWPILFASSLLPHDLYSLPPYGFLMAYTHCLLTLPHDLFSLPPHGFLMVYTHCLLILPHDLFS
jgi:hypothetical protein